MATIAVSKMTKAQAEAALADAETCTICQTAHKQDGSFRIWHVCPAGAGYVRVQLNLSHRLHYLTKLAKKKQLKGGA